MGIGWGGAEFVRARIVSLFICIGADLHTGAQREAEGGRGALCKMGHRLSALQQKLNLTNCMNCIEPWRNGVDLQIELPRYRNICEQYPERAH